MYQPLLLSPTKDRRDPACCLSVNEIMTIQILFQMVGYRNFNTFYTGFSSRELPMLGAVGIKMAKIQLLPSF